jgi:hypothetical protein
MLTTAQANAAYLVGKAIAKDVLREDMPRQWTGLDPQDADQLTAVGLEPRTPEWYEAESIALAIYSGTIGEEAEVE